MRVLLKTIKQIDTESPDRYDGHINSVMEDYFGKPIELKPNVGDGKTGPEKYPYQDQDGWGYKKEWIVGDHDLLKALKRCLDRE